MQEDGRVTLYVATDGNDAWSGALAAPAPDGTDGPVATIERARDIVRERKLAGRLAGPLTIAIRGGRYPIARPLTFGPDDSGPITYAAYPGERPVLDGGTRIDGWRTETIGSTAVWVTDVPEVAAGTWYFHQLWVDGARRRRARLPKDGFYWMEGVPGMTFAEGRFVDQLFAGASSFVSAPGDIQSWRNLGDVEVLAPHYWIEERMPIASFDEQTRTVTSSRRSMFALRDDVAARYARYYVENVFEGLSAPGEWYLDRPAGRLYYVPMPGEDPATAEVYAPRTEHLLTLIGRPEEGRYVEFLRFEGLTFRHAEWRQPTGTGGLFDDADDALFGRDAGVALAAAPQAACNVPGALYLEGARYCAIDDCTVERVGYYAVELAAGCMGNRVVGNTFHDLGAGGVKMNGSAADGPVARRTGHNRVTDNHIHAGGRVFPAAVGILVAHAFGNDISHNHIHDLYYSGVSCGWVWGYADSVSKDNRIEKNHIHDLGHGLLSDMGGIYTLGVQPGTVLRGNLIHDVEKHNYGGWAIYLDEGSSHILVEDNICYNTSSQVFNQHYGRENVVRNNIFAFGREGQVSLGRAEAHNAFTFERNIVIAADRPVFVAGYAGQLEKRGFRSDLNLFWDASGRPWTSGNGQFDAEAHWAVRRAFTFEEWTALGNDRHSLVADPRCRDLRTFDVSLGDDSPAFGLGFRPIDSGDVGPRPRGKRGE